MDKSPSSPSPNLRQLLHDKDVHIRNLEALIIQRDREIEQLQGDLANPALREASLGRTKDFWRPPARAAVSATPPAGGAKAPRTPPRSPARVFRDWWFDLWVGSSEMQVGVLRQYPARPLRPESFPAPSLPDGRLPQIAVVTPSFNQAPFVEATLRSILDQDYPRLLYAVHDGASSDGSPEIIARQAGRLAYWNSAGDRGQSDAIGKGFASLAARLGPDDIMSWLNSDDLAMPGSLRYVAEYFARHPEVDVVYGHRVIIDDDAREVGRWILPRHDPRALEWVDYVPQETLFWRKRAWDRAGGLDPAFQFALDWDLLARFTQAGLRIVRLPRFLGCFRVHEAQKTHQHIHSTGAEEMARVRRSFHGPDKADDMLMVEAWARRTRLRGAVTARLLSWGIRV